MSRLAYPSHTSIFRYKVIAFFISLAFVLAVGAKMVTSAPKPVANTYTVVYVGNGNTGGRVPVDTRNPYNAGAMVGVLGMGSLTKSDFQFGGWNTAADGSGVAYAPAKAFIINANTTLYAQWKVPQCFSAGSLDPSFNSSGIVTAFLSDTSYDGGTALVVQPDGKLVVAGHGNSFFDRDFVLMRFNPDGSLDETFDGDGKVSTPLGQSDDIARAVAIQPDGKIVAAGYAVSAPNTFFALVRYNADGSLDTTFGNGGKVISSIYGGDAVNSLLIQLDGKIVAVGEASVNNRDYFALARYNADGSLDATFDGDGIVTTSILDFYDAAYGAVLQTDGKIVVGGFTGGNFGTVAAFGLVRYNTDGSLDSTFDGDGKVVTDFVNGVELLYSLELQPDGKIIAAGIAKTSSSKYQFALARYNADGSLDTSFGDNGIVMTTILGVGNGDYARSVALQPDGKIVMAGGSDFGSGTDFELVRYNTDGSLDTTFDRDGKIVTDLRAAKYGSGDIANSIALQSDGKVIAGGSTYVGRGGFALTRYGTVDCTPVSTASLSGRVIINNNNRIGIRNAKVVVTGSSLQDPIVATTGSFGYFTFDGLVTGEEYIVTVNSRGYAFSVPTQVVTLPRAVNDANFFGDPIQ